MESNKAPLNGKPEDAAESLREEEEFYFDYIDSIGGQEDIWRFSKSVAEYVEEEKVPNVVFMDGSAREAFVGIDEYWNLKHKGEQDAPEKPKFLFMNPRGFRNADEFKKKKYALFGAAGPLSKLPPDTVKKKAEVLEDFQQTFDKLMADKNKPVLLIDTCAHSGRSIRNVKDVLSDAGFTDVRVITASPPDKISGIDTVLMPLQKCHHECYPFSSPTEGRLVADTGNVVSGVIKFSNKFDAQVARNEARALRREIRKIIQIRMK